MAADTDTDQDMDTDTVDMDMVDTEDIEDDKNKIIPTKSRSLRETHNLIVCCMTEFATFSKASKFIQNFGYEILGVGGDY